jgi:hypothetical protein
LKRKTIYIIAIYYGDGSADNNCQKTTPLTLFYRFKRSSRSLRSKWRFDAAVYFRKHSENGAKKHLCQACHQQ